MSPSASMALSPHPGILYAPRDGLLVPCTGQEHKLLQK